MVAENPDSGTIRTESTGIGESSSGVGGTDAGGSFGGSADSDAGSGSDAPRKRGRGRPRKEASQAFDIQASPVTPQKKRGRPRKNATPVPNIAVSGSAAYIAQLTQLCFGMVAEMRGSDHWNISPVEAAMVGKSSEGLVNSVPLPSGKESVIVSGIMTSVAILVLGASRYMVELRLKRFQKQMQEQPNNYNSSMNENHTVYASVGEV